MRAELHEATRKLAEVEERSVKATSTSRELVEAFKYRELQATASKLAAESATSVARTDAHEARDAMMTLGRELKAVEEREEATLAISQVHMHLCRVHPHPYTSA